MLRVAWWLAVAWAAVYGVATLWYSFDCSDPGEIGSGLIFYGAMLLVMAVYVRNRLGEPWKELVPLRRVDPSLVIPLVLLAAGGWVVSSQLVRFCVALNVLPPEVSDLAGGSQSGGFDPGQPLTESLVANALFPGIFEEAIWRGLVLQALLSMMSQRRAIAISALFFAAWHFRIERMSDIVLLGIVYGWIAVRTGSLLPSMLAHALHDAVCVLVSRGLLLEELQAGVDRYGLLPAAWVWVALAITVIGLWWIRRATKPPRSETVPIPASRYRAPGYPARPFATAPAARASLW